MSHTTAAPSIADPGALTSRERVRRALRHQEPDRVPLDYSANPDIDRRLKAHFGLAHDDDEGLRLALGVDFRRIHAPYTGPRLHPEIPNRIVDPQWGTRCKWVQHASGGYWDFCDSPLLDAPDDTIANWPLPNPDHHDYARVRTLCRTHHDRFLFVGDPGLADTI